VAVRREGLHGAVFWWVVKLGMAAALAGGSFLLNATGFDVAPGIAIWAIASFPITEERMHEVRFEFEARRGTT
jgi:glycoside/pentoside/hexuronide:cation symporter, GPH family